MESLGRSPGYDRRSLMMMSNAIPLIALCVVVATAGCSETGTTTSTQTPPAVSTTLDSDDVASLQATLNQREEELANMARGTSLLLTLSEQPQRYGKLLEFLKTIGPDELRCTIRNLTDYPLVLYMYHRSYVLPDGSHRPVFDRKSALVLLDAKTLLPIDFVVGTGYRTEEHGLGEPWITQWEQQDGTCARFRILASGFERIGNNRQ